MKRILVCLMAAVLVMTAAPGAAAASGNTYELPELKMSIEMPDGWLVWTRDTAPDDSLLEGTSFKTEKVHQEMSSTNVYIKAVEPEFPWKKIMVSMNDSSEYADMISFKGRSELFLKSYEMGLCSYLDSQGFSVYSVTRYEHSQATFIVAEVVTKNDDTPSMIFVTVMNGKQINVTLEGRKGKVSLYQKDIKLLYDVVDSIVFTEAQEVPEVPVPDAGYTLDIDKLGLTLDVPAGWVAITRDVEEGDPRLHLVGLSANRLYRSMYNEGVYAYLVNPDLHTEIAVHVLGSAEEMRISGINDWSSPYAVASLVSIRFQLENSGGIDIISADFHRSGRMSYLAYDYRLTDKFDGRYSRLYITEWEGKALSIMATVYAGELTEGIGSDFEAVAGSLRPQGTELYESAEEPAESAEPEVSAEAPDVKTVPAFDSERFSPKNIISAYWLFNVVGAIIAAIVILIRKQLKGG